MTELSKRIKLSSTSSESLSVQFERSEQQHLEDKINTVIALDASAGICGIEDLFTNNSSVFKPALRDVQYFLRLRLKQCVRLAYCSHVELAIKKATLVYIKAIKVQHRQFYFRNYQTVSFEA